MISYGQVKKYCCEDISKIEGYDKAIADNKNIWCCHHKLGLYFDKQWLIDNGLYYEQRAEMLVFMKQGKHQALHQSFKTGTNHPGYGKKASLETRKKLSKARKGIKKTEEWKRKIAEAQTGKYNNPLKSKKVFQYTKNLTFVKEWDSTAEIQRTLGYSASTISKCCRGIKNYKSFHGFIWSYTPL